MAGADTIGALTRREAAAGAPLVVAASTLELAPNPAAPTTTSIGADSGARASGLEAAAAAAEYAEAVVAGAGAGAAAAKVMSATAVEAEAASSSLCSSLWSGDPTCCGGTAGSSDA
jgi:hypothetical protein